MNRYAFLSNPLAIVKEPVAIVKKKKSKRKKVFIKSEELQHHCDICLKRIGSPGICMLCRSARFREEHPMLYRRQSRCIDCGINTVFENNRCTDCDWKDAAKTGRYGFSSALQRSEQRWKNAAITFAVLFCGLMLGAILYAVNK